MIPLISNLDFITSGLINGNRSEESFFPINSPLYAVFKVIHVSHFCFRLIQKHRSYIRNKNEIEFVVSNFLNFYLTNRSIVHYAAQCVLITKTLVHIMNTQAKVSRATQHFMNCMTIQYPLPTAFIKEERSINLSHLDQPSSDRVISTFSSLPKPLLEVSLVINIVAKATFELISQYFTLSIQILELFEAFIMDRITQYESITGLLENSREIYNTLSNDPNALIEELDRNEFIINNILTLSQMPFKVKEMKCKIIEIYDISQRISESVHPAINNVFNAMQKVSYEFSYLMGASLVPSKSFNKSVRSFREYNTTFDSSRSTRERIFDERYYTIS